MSYAIVTEQPSSRTVTTARALVAPATTITVEVGKTPALIQGPKGDKGDAGVQGIPGIQGLRGLPGAVVVGTGDLSYDHFQAMASAVWVIAHGLGKFPNVTVIDSSGNECEGAISYNNLNQITVTFSAAFGGHAYLN
jgi:hypothetical protein